MVVVNRRVGFRLYRRYIVRYNHRGKLNAYLVYNFVDVFPHTEDCYFIYNMKYLRSEL